jgi:lysophospholipase L1-like esterase
VDATGDTLDDDTASYNAQRREQRDGVFWLDLRDRDAAFRAELRGALNLAALKSVRTLYLGDSKMVGYRAADLRSQPTDPAGPRSWLHDLLDRERITETPYTLAGGGWTLATLQTQLNAVQPAQVPDYAFVDVGINDAKTGDLLNWQARYVALCQQVLGAGTGVKLVLLSMCYARASGETNITFASQQQVKGYISAAAVALTAQFPGRVTLVDLASSTPLETETGIPSQWTAQGVHPLDAGYLREAQLMLSGMRTLGL